MTEAPERILAWPWPDKPHQGLWHVSPFDRDGATEYIRADIHDAAVSAARKEGMREGTLKAAKTAETAGDSYYMIQTGTGFEKSWGGAFAFRTDIATAIRAAAEAQP